MSAEQKPFRGQMLPGNRMMYCEEEDGGEKFIAPVTPCNADDPLPEGEILVFRDEDGFYRPRLAGGTGPAQVATEAYRRSFERIFGGKQVVGQA